MGFAFGRGVAPAAYPSAKPSLVRTLNVLACAGTGMQTDFAPALRTTTSFWPNMRLLRVPLKMVTRVRAGLLLDEDGGGSGLPW